MSHAREDDPMAPPNEEDAYLLAMETEHDAATACAVELCHIAKGGKFDSDKVRALANEYLRATIAGDDALNAMLEARERDERESEANR